MSSSAGNWAMIQRPPLEEGVTVDLRCEICWESEGGTMLECQGCKLRVHSACYGGVSSASENAAYGRAELPAASSNDFTCCECVYWKQLAVHVSPHLLVCSLCNRTGGPMKCSVEGLWVHVACVLYSNDGPIFRNYTARSCPINLQKCLRQRLQCYICLNTVGFATKCSFPGCNKRMHITCAFQQSLKPRIVLISAKVPLTMYRDASVENCETKTVEKIIKIVTCAQHSSQNAQNAIENYEISQLQKTDLSRLCQRTSAPAEQPTAPPQPSMMDSSQLPPGVGPPTMPYHPYAAAAQANGAPAGAPPQQQWGYPPQYFYYNQPPMGYYNTWSPHQYGYAQHILQRTAPYPNWGTNQYSMQQRMTQQPPNTAMSPTPSLARVRTTQTMPPTATAAAAPKVTAKVEPKKKVKSKAHAGASTVKAEPSATSPVDNKKKRSSTNKASSNSGGRQKTGDTSSKAKDKGKANTARASRFRASDDYAGCPTTLRGSRVNWQKLDPFMHPLQANEPTNRLITLLDCLERGGNSVVKQAVRWSWIREPGPPVRSEPEPSPAPSSASNAWSLNKMGFSAGTSFAFMTGYSTTAPKHDPAAVAAPAAEESTTEEETEEQKLELLKHIWHSRRDPVSGESAYSVVLSAELRDKVKNHIWSFWRNDDVVDFTQIPKRYVDILSSRPLISPEEVSEFTDYQKRHRPTADDEVMMEPSESTRHALARSYEYDARQKSFNLENTRRQDSVDFLTNASRSVSLVGSGQQERGSEALLEGTQEPWNCSSAELIFGFNRDKCKIDSLMKMKEFMLEKHGSEAFNKLITRAIVGDTHYERKSLSLDICSWNEISRLETLFARCTTSSLFVLLRKVPPELFSSAKHVPANAMKYLQDKENATFALDASLLKKTASTTKKINLHSRFWDLNPPIPISDTRALLPKNSYSVTAGVNFADYSADYVPISDETTREWLTATQRVRQLRSQQHAAATAGVGGGVGGSSSSMDLSAPDFQKAVRGEEFVKLLSTEQYWHTLLFKDDFVRRQMASTLLIWSKRRARIIGGFNRLRDLVKNERDKRMWAPDSPATLTAVQARANAANRWSTLRWWFQQGHQDPGQALVDRLEMEHKHRHLIQDGIPPPTGDPNAPGATSTKMYFCMACFAGDTDSLNPLVTCIRCGCLAHNFCYAIGAPGQLEMESHPWICDRCTSDKSSAESHSAKNNKQLSPPPPAYCAVCLQFGGCLKSFGSSGAFIHVTCAIWFFPIINCGDWASLTDWHITLPSSENHLFGDEASPHEKRYRIVDDVMLTAQQLEELNGDPKVAYCHVCGPPPENDAPTKTQPFGKRGLVMQCCSEDCSKYYHPMCAWLAGCRVYAHYNPYRTLTSPGLVALDIYSYCLDHSNYEGRLAADVIAAHRYRAYCTKTGRFAGSSTNEAKDAAAAVGGASGGAKRTGAVRSETRRPSLSGDTEILTASWSVACTTRLTTVDVYLETVCQACISNFDAVELQSCEACDGVRVHAGCDLGVFDPAQKLCVSCQSDEPDNPPTCFLCPRLGGAFVSPTENSYVHRYCLAAATGRMDVDMAQAWESIQQLRSENGECSICGVSSGYLVECEGDECTVLMHPLCGALTREGNDDVCGTLWPRLCANHYGGEGETWSRLHHPAVTNATEELESIVSSNPPAADDASSPDRRRAKRKRITLFGESSDDER